MTQTFDQWFQLRLDSLRRQNEWRKIDCLLASKEYVRDAWRRDLNKGENQNETSRNLEILLVSCWI